MPLLKFDTSFKDVYNKFVSEDQIKIQSESPVGVFPKQFLKPIKKSALSKEILIQKADGDNFMDVVFVSDYLKNLFYFTSKLSSSDYEFKISKIKQIFFQGTAVVFRREKSGDQVRGLPLLPVHLLLALQQALHPQRGHRSQLQVMFSLIGSSSYRRRP